MNRTFLLGVFAFVVVWTGFWFYNGENHTLNVAVTIWSVLVGAIIVIHLFLDRDVRFWDAASMGVLLREVGFVAIFCWFWYLLSVTRTNRDPGIEQGLLDTVRTVAIVGSPMLAFSVISIHAQKRRTGKPRRPGDLLDPPDPTLRRRHTDWAAQPGYPHTRDQGDG